MISHTWNLKYDRNESISEGRVGRGMEWEFGVSRCKLVYIEWIIKVLLYSTGNYIQYPVKNYSGKEHEKE